MSSPPEPVALAADVMSTFPGTWALCGGWAVDASLGRQTRDHLDVDICIFNDELSAVFDHLSGWHMVAHSVGSSLADDHAEPWDGRDFELPAHIHATPDRDSLVRWVGGEPGDGFKLDIEIDERQGGEWILLREPRVALPLERAFRQSAWSMPAAVDEVLLFYKATAYYETKGIRRHDESDFNALLPQVDDEQRSWLRETISSVFHKHPWLARL